MDGLVRRFADAKQADVDRNQLISYLLERVGDMEKVMDRNGFVLVLLDGDCMNFVDSLVEQGICGGEDASKKLRSRVWHELRHEPNFRHDHKIVIRIFANLRGLSKKYADTGILSSPNDFQDFVLGFNKSNPLCDFVDAGNHKEAADKKLQETLNLYLYNVHCKHIIFGASADNSYASFLGSFHDVDVSSRIRLLKGPPFAPEFRSILPRFKQVEFSDIFRSQLLPTYLERAKQPSRSSVVETPGTHHSSMSEQMGLYLSTGPMTNASNTCFTTKIEHDSATDSTEKRANSFAADSSQRSELDERSKSPSISKDLQPQQPFTISRASLGTDEFKQQDAVALRPEVEEALIRATNEQLGETPDSCDFGLIRSRVEQALGISPAFWGNSGTTSRRAKSKVVIKWAVENWMEDNDCPPPGNATWLHNRFESLVSPASVLRSPGAQEWRIKPEPGWCDYISATPSFSATTSPSEPSSNTFSGSVRKVYRNVAGQRIDVPAKLEASPVLLQSLRDRSRRLCNAYTILGHCPLRKCEYEHDSKLGNEAKKAWTYYARSIKCSDGSACDDPSCTKGHMCPHPEPCMYKHTCWFFELHGSDTKPVN